MTATSASKKPVLLEAGTNELEVLVFSVANQSFGVNVAKVREILPIPTIASTPECSDMIEGVVTIRDVVVPLVHLGRCLYPDEYERTILNDADRLLMLEFNQNYLGFRVNTVERIYRISWKDVLPPPSLPGDDVPVTAVVLLNNTIVPLLDFESLGAKLGMPSFSTQQSDVTAVAGKDRSSFPIVLADDSPLIRKLMTDRLCEAGYTNLEVFNDGEEAWNFLQDVSNTSSAADLSGRVAGVITDIEMPRMDGLSLTKRVRQTPLLKDLPVILFSSIASEANANKAQQVGANAQISKPESDKLADTLTQLLEESSVV